MALKRMDIYLQRQPSSGLVHIDGIPMLVFYTSIPNGILAATLQMLIDDYDVEQVVTWSQSAHMDKYFLLQKDDLRSGRSFSIPVMPSDA